MIQRTVSLDKLVSENQLFVDKEDAEPEDLVSRLSRFSEVGTKWNTRAGSISDEQGNQGNGDQNSEVATQLTALQEQLKQLSDQLVSVKQHVDESLVSMETRLTQKFELSLDKDPADRA